MYLKYTRKIGSASQANQSIDNFPPPSSSEEIVDLMLFDEPTNPVDQSDPVELMLFDEPINQIQPAPISIPNDYHLSAATCQKRPLITWEKIVKILSPDHCSFPKSISSDHHSLKITDLEPQTLGRSLTIPPQKQNPEPINRDQRDTQSASAPINALLSPLRFPSTGIVTETPVADNDFVYSNPSQVGYPQQMLPFTQGGTHVQPNQGMTVYPRRQKEPKPSVTPYKAYQKLVSQYYFKVFEGSLYIFQNGVYHHLDSEMAKTLIMELCAEELSVTGQPRFISDTLDFLLTSARNKIVEEAIKKT